MDTPNDIIKEIERLVWGYNEYWDKPALTSELRTNPLEALAKIISYCTILKNSKDRITKVFKDNPEDIKMIVKYIIDICNDGIDRREDQPSIKEGKTINHRNGKWELTIESSLSDYHLDRIIKCCEELKESVESEKASYNFNKFLGKFIEFEGCEDGSYIVLFDQISKKSDGTWVYSGVDIFFTTSNNYGDGILINSVKDSKFTKLPYNPLDDVDKDEMDECLYNWLEECTEYSSKELVECMQRSILNCVRNSDISYVLKKFNNKDNKDE